MIAHLINQVKEICNIKFTYTIEFDSEFYSTNDVYELNIRDVQFKYYDRCDEKYNYECVSADNWLIMGGYIICYNIIVFEFYGGARFKNIRLT